MKIGVVSDTHSLAVPQVVLDSFKTVDLIIHTGDFCSMEDLKIFSKIKDVKAVFGNMDDVKVRQAIPERLIFKVEDVVIGLYHGAGAPKNILACVQAQFEKDKVDVVVFGHSHEAFNERINNVLYFNPGSPNDIVRAPFRSYGILEVNKNKVVGKIVKIKD